MKKSIKFWFEEDLLDSLKVFAIRKHTTVSAVLRVACRAILRYQRAEFHLEERQKQQQQVQSFKSSYGQRIPKSELKRAIEEKQKEGFAFAEAAVHMELQDYDKRYIATMMGQDISASGVVSDVDNW